MTNKIQSSPLLYPFQEFIEKTCKNWQPFLEKTIQKIALGVLAGTTKRAVVIAAEYMMPPYEYDGAGEEAIIEEWHQISDSPPGYEMHISETKLFWAMTVVIPLIEECFFRGVILSATRNCISYFGANPTSTCSKIIQIISNGLIFGFCHLSPRQGQANTPIFIGTSLGGFVLAGLREFTGDITAPLIAHIVYNGLTESAALSEEL
jgi:membrane protease YdiL (CAAX protease family)